MLRAIEPELLTIEVLNAFDIWAPPLGQPRECRHPLLPSKLDSLGNIFVADSMGSKLNVFGQKRQKTAIRGHNTIQGHSRSPIFVLMESYAFL